MRYTLSVFPIGEEHLFIASQPRTDMIYIGKPYDMARKNLRPQLRKNMGLVSLVIGDLV
jgi:hypothetical protein